MASRKEKAKAYGLVVKIRHYWTQACGARFYAPKVKVDEETAIISSDMVNGYPPARPIVQRGRGR